MSEEGRLVAGRYRLLERIGRGGMGTVWRAEDELLGRLVAVKRLYAQPQLQDDELATLFERTRREARAAARISHPNVVVVHDVVDDEGLPTIVMEYVPSVTLAELLKKDGPLPPEAAARVCRAMLDALRAAHAAGVLHRDVKPGNVLLGETGRVVLTDFGIAQASGTSTLTRTGELIGSIDFLPPERLTGGSAPGPEADLWALGATLYQMVEGRSPFRRETAMETAYAIATAELEPPGRAGPLAPLITGLLERDPGDRPTAGQVERMLRGVAAEPETATVEQASLERPTAVETAAPEPVRQQQTPPGVPREETIQPTPAKGRRKSPAKLVAAVAVAAVLVGGGAFLLGGHIFPRGDGGTGAAHGATSSPAATPSASPSPSWTPPALPRGYRLAHEKALGFSVPVPKGWTREVADTGDEVRYISPDGLVGLRIGALDFAGPSPLRNWQSIEGDTEAKVDDYQRLRMWSTSWRGEPAAIWEFTFQGSARKWHAKDLGFGKEGGTGYAVYLSAPDARWGQYTQVFDTAVDGFRTTG